MAQAKVVSIDHHASWRGRHLENSDCHSRVTNITLFRKLARFSSDCGFIAKHLVRDGALNIEWREDCLMISRKSSYFQGLPYFENPPA